MAGVPPHFDFVKLNSRLNLRLEAPGILTASVGDPDPDTQDPHVFGPPGSGSISQRCGSCSGSGSFPFLIKVKFKFNILFSFFILIYYKILQFYLL